MSAAQRSDSRFHLPTFGVVAGVAAVLVLVAQLAGVSFAMRIVEDGAVSAKVAALDTFQSEGAISAGERNEIERDLLRQEVLELQLAGGALEGPEAIEARRELRPEGQGLVIGLGGLKGFAPPLVAAFLAGLVAALVFRGRRTTEVAAGAATALAVQAIAWLGSAGFAVGAVLGWDMILLGDGPGFGGSAIMLVGMTLVLSMIAAVGAAHLTSVIADVASGTINCPQCHHRYSLPAKGSRACPACGNEHADTPRYRGGEDFLGELGGAPTATRASMGAEELLCLRCAKTYEADACPLHPHEPLLDPRQDSVKLTLADLDAQGGTTRFARWTDGLGVGAPTPVIAGPRLCMECAKTYDSEHCPVHRDEPLLNPGSEDVRLELIAADDRARGRMSTMLMFAAAGVSVLLCGLTFATLDAGLSLGGGVFVGSLVLLVTIASVVAPRLAPPRYSKWTGEADVDLDEFGMGAQAVLMQPLRQALTRMRQEAARIVIAMVIGAATGAGLALAISWSAAAGGMLGALLALLGYAVVTTIIARARGLRAAVSDAQAAWNDPYAKTRG